MTQQLTCERCGYTEDIEFPVDENGKTITAADYIAALKAASIPVLCSGCAEDDRAAEEYRNPGSG